MESGIPANETRTNLLDAGDALHPLTPPVPRGDKAAGEGSVALGVVVRLLQEAEQSLWRDKKGAQLRIAKAKALLKVEVDAGNERPGASAATARSGLAPWQVSSVSKFVDANLAEKIELSQLAALVRLSKSHFARAFRLSVGLSPYAFIIRHRVERAQTLLCLTDKSLCEIALECGFADQSHLTRRFRRMVGLSPGAWRRRHGQALAHDFVLGPDRAA